MKRASLVSISAVATLAAGVSLLSVGRSSATQPAAPTVNAEGTKLLGRLPVAFVPNLGQWDHAARYVARFGGMTVFLQDRGWTFTLAERSQGQTESVPPMHPMARADRKPEPVRGRGVAVQMTFASASEPTLVAEERLPGRHNYFLGNDPSKWRSDVPLYASVRYREVQPGVDVRAREHHGHFEYDLLLQPDADLEPVEIAVEGIERMRLDEGGALVMETRLGPVHMPAPLSWQEGPSGERSLITCRYVLRGDNRFRFEVTGRRPGWRLTVDPGLVYSTYLGGRGNDQVHALALDAQGAATVAGDTDSVSFPTTPGAFDTSRNGGIDAFITRLSPSGSSLVYSTYLGGIGGDIAYALALDAQGAATVAGSTSSTNFPTTPSAFDTSYHGGHDVFITRLSSTGSSLVYSTFLGTIGEEYASALALDAQGAAAVAGWTNWPNFPTTPGAFDTNFNGRGSDGDAFVTRLSPTGSNLVYSTFLGGAGDEVASAVAVDAQGTATVAGLTSSTDFPTTPGAYSTSLNGGVGHDAFVTRLSPTGVGLVFSTFLGGAGLEQVHALALDAQGGATVAGRTSSTNFPTTSIAFDTTYHGGIDAFVTRLSPTGSSLVFSTFLGGWSLEFPTALALDSQGAATVAGWTRSSGFPTTPGAFDTRFIGNEHAFVTRLSPSGSKLVYSTFLGGWQSGGATALAIDAQGAATVAGWTISSDFPATPGSFDTSFNGNVDAFITRLDMLPTGVAAFGRSSPGCTGPLAISVNSMPQVGNAGFALTCGNAPPNTTGLLAFTGNAFANPVVLLGVEIWIDPRLVFMSLPASSNNVGACEVPLPIPNGPWLQGTGLFAQFFWAGPTSPPPCPSQGLSATNALEFTVQP